MTAIKTVVAIDRGALEEGRDATQIIIQGTQLGSEPTPPAPPQVTAGSNVRGN